MDTNFKLSEYQEKILHEVKYGNGNILVDAKAGSGKTSTLLLIANEIIKQNKNCLFLAFNKSIVNELQSRILSDNVEIKTLHSLGLSFVRSYLYRKHRENYELEIDHNDERIKNYVIELFDKYCMQSFRCSKAVENLNEDDIRDTYNALIREIRQMVNYVRLYNINSKEYKQVISLGTELCWNLKDWENLNLDKYPKIIEDTINKLKEEFENPEFNEDNIPVYTIGYTDMIYFPCLYRMFPPFSIKKYLDYILCDECQDLSVLQQLFLKLLYKGDNRFIFVGDEKQAIYGFAGADTKSIQNLKRNFYLKELPLNICYRCPENVIKIAQDIVPTIDWNHNRDDKGEVKFVKEETLKDNVKPGDIILGRRNKDLLRIYRDFILKYKMSIKFKNEEMVTTIVNEITRVVKEYIRKYNQFLNVEKDLHDKLILKNIDIMQPYSSFSKSDLAIIEKTYNELIKQNKTKNKGKEILKRGYTVRYLQKCMDEFKVEGGYNYSIDETSASINVDYFDIIYYFVETYLNEEGNKNINEFVHYMENFLKANLNKEVPILSSIHMMKGGEADNVYILDYPRFPYIYGSQTLDAQQQEKNLQYVAITRPKKNLYLCEISKLKPREKEEDILEKNVKCMQEVNSRLKQ